MVIAVAEKADYVGVMEAEEDVKLLTESAVEALAGAVELDGHQGEIREASEVDGAGSSLADHRGVGELDLRPTEPPWH